ncbi:hypothetical protein K7X08_010157 [Anisodus acutangulus]|uniref:Coenzyme Q-binding protein COQ10 START domain-containing protein n=1 Tax=Anisodus acutangulus TaxID=402998 RepID=A0A9Q1N533_9SOLA|nr:hypothetical protein K7X08_010157 [Anisodus acutangulus]
MRSMSIPKEPEQVMKQRDGSVLGKKTILKSDNFSGCQNRRLSPHIDGAPNYRKADSLHVHGVAIPTVEGIQNVLDHIGAQLSGKKTHILWVNLREEPISIPENFIMIVSFLIIEHVIYINGRPFVLREVERPFSNLEYTGINRKRAEEMEDRLKEGVLLEAARYGNKILVTDELPDGQMVDQWEPVTYDSVKTPLQVYEELQSKEYLVEYERVPITDEKSPKELDFDVLIIFNCQMGRGRTTTGMVIATLVYLNRIGSSGFPRSNSIGRVSDCISNLNDTLANSEEAIRRGEYDVIRSLIRVLEGGVEGKRQVEKVIDKCSSMQNLREAIAIYRNSILRQPDEMKKEAPLSFFVEYLERYYFLICFAVYLHTQRDALFSRSPAHCSFSDWMKARPELYSILGRFLRRDPMGALGYASLKPSLAKSVDTVDSRPSGMGQVAALRNGEVLGPQTVLKSDHCPDCQHPGLPEILEGAPNFREIPGFPVYGVANPTVSGRPVFWHNMREEPVIYINGKPFGIDRERVEKMEARLKDDIMREADRYQGAIMVIHETDDSQIFDAWEHVSSDAVQTPVEVFKWLEADGFPIKYARVPITDGKAPKSSDFDVLSFNIASAPKDTAFVFNCQMGIGRTTTGTVTACLLKLRIDCGRPIRVLHDASNLDLGGGMSSDDESEGQAHPPASLVLKSRPQTHTNDAFGINDILLLCKITRVFDNGVECREALDAIIDRCSALQNIRQAVLQYRKLFNQQHNEPRERKVALNRGAEYLERYFPFDGFCRQGESRMTFKDWLHQRLEVQAMKWSIRLRPGRFFTIPEELKAPHESQHGDAVMEAVVKDRNGSVLGKGSILKMYFFPGQRTSSHIQIHGAPHVYKVDGYPIYSMATPTIAGAKEMLTCLGAKQTSKEGFAKRIILTDLREEAVVYINGTPFVLRELNKPVESLKHVGITGPLVEHLETRLKDDIQCEIRQSGGRMLLHREEYNPTSNQVIIIGYWENIFVDDVKTPAEVYASLKYEGYDITYRRIPLTREKYSQELERNLDEGEERRAHLMYMGIRALRRYFFLITFRSYLYCCSPAEITFSEWMDARPELGHLAATTVHYPPPLSDIWSNGGVGDYDDEDDEEGDGDDDDYDDDGVEIEIEKMGKNCRRIRSKVAVKASLQNVWKVLTDYERLADFIPGLAVSKLLEKEPNFARLLQIGEQDLAFGLKFNAKGVIDCYEKDLEDLPTGQRRDIEFKMVEGDFKKFEGKWSIEQCKTDGNKDHDSVGQPFHTTLSYIVDVEPKLWLPVRVIEGRLCKEVKINLRSVREEAQKVYLSSFSSY